MAAHKSVEGRESYSDMALCIFLCTASERTEQQTPVAQGLLSIYASTYFLFCN